MGTIGLKNDRAIWYFDPGSLEPDSKAAILCLPIHIRNHCTIGIRAARPTLATKRVEP